jgi:D-3-phosphoglycerate dehydrogenase
LINCKKIGIENDIDTVTDKAGIEEKMAHYQGIVIRSRFPIDKQFIDCATQLRFIARVGAGLENIDVAYAKKKRH